MECLKLYDKQENGTMLLAELEHSLKALGEKLSEDELAELFADCMDPEDEDGNIPYARKCRTFHEILQINKCPSTSIKFDLLLMPKIHLFKNIYGSLY